MDIHGQAEFSVLADPIVSISDNTKVLYNTFTAFEEDEMLFNYVLADGVAYVSRSVLNGSFNEPEVKCMDSNVLPPVNAIAASLSEAKPVAKIVAKNGTVIPCARENSFKTSVNGIEFGLCFSGASGFSMYGGDVDISVVYVDNHMAIEAPTLDENVRKECKKVVSSSAVTPIGKSLLTGEQIPVSEERESERLFDFLFGDSCSCRSTPRPCIFIHGLGVLDEKEENLDSYNEYWGDMTGHTPCCSSTKYAVLNTVNNSWTDDIQQEKVCRHILDVSETSNGTTVADTIIISHSMGGLMLAGAIANNRCSLDKSTTWVSAGSPMTGSMAAEYFEASCNDNTNFLMEKFVETTGFCPPDDGIKSLAYQDSSFSSPDLNMAYIAAQKAYRDNVYALMCSNSFSGILSSYQYGFWIMGSLIPHESWRNDGMVEFHSCAGGFPESKFSDDFRDRFYVSKLNHYDVSFKAGDAVLDKAKMPVKWFECLL
ncbi:hypothetical protein PHMEG_00031508 [Phytophthora megakarya]|uniref:Uncharacterized protein n=1 Tax=Phytophthora megakarya TaxID=4795 RepID=A0A225UYP0_9STRA|nr:hypothetical protein PHMEG_00031508 [Phytophthora megakarya]